MNITKIKHQFMNCKSRNSSENYIIFKNTSNIKLSLFYYLKNIPFWKKSLNKSTRNSFIEAYHTLKKYKQTG